MSMVEKTLRRPQINWDTRQILIITPVVAFVKKSGVKVPPLLCAHSIIYLAEINNLTVRICTIKHR